MPREGVGAQGGLSLLPRSRWVTNKRCWHGGLITSAVPALELPWGALSPRCVVSDNKPPACCFHAHGRSVVTKCFPRQRSSYPIPFHVFNINPFIRLGRAGDSLLCACAALVSVPRGVWKQRSRASSWCSELAMSSLGAWGGRRDTGWECAASRLAPHLSVLILPWSPICYRCLSFSKCEMGPSGHLQSVACDCLSLSLGWHLDKLGTFFILFFIR